MASLTRPFTSHFADVLKEGDVFSIYRDGEFPVRITAPPVLVKNLVGDRHHVVIQVAKVNAPGTTGQMILSPSNVVFIRTSREP